MSSWRLSFNEQRFREAVSAEERNFTFVVGGVEYPCNRFQACLVSGLVCRLVRSDCYLERLELHISDEFHHFQEVAKLVGGGAIRITPENSTFLLACARELEINELLARLDSELNGGQITFSNVVHRIRVKSKAQSDYQKELDFVASHFFEAGIDVLRCLSVPQLMSILESPQLKIKSEDQLYHTVISLARSTENNNYLVLLRYIRMKMVTEFRPNEVLGLLFPDLIGSSELPCERAPSEVVNPSRYHPTEITPGRGAFHGIFHTLRELAGGQNPHERGLISITASADECHPGRIPCWQVIDPGHKNWWASTNDHNAFIQIDFQWRRVCLSAYSIRSDGNDYHHLRHWVIEVSDNGSVWEIIDKRDTQDLVGKFIEKTYTCGQPNNKFVRYVRLRQTGTSHSEYYHLLLNQIEFFGKIIN